MTWLYGAFGGAWPPTSAFFVRSQSQPRPSLSHTRWVTQVWDRLTGRGRAGLSVLCRARWPTGGSWCRLPARAEVV